MPKSCEEHLLKSVPAHPPAAVRAGPSGIMCQTHSTSTLRDCSLRAASFMYREPKMTMNLSEEEMRQALFGSSRSTPEKVDEAAAVNPARAPVKPVPKKTSSPRLRVTLKVTKAFEGEEEIFTYDANTLSRIMAEQEARNAAKKKRYKYFELVSIVSA